MSDKIVAVKTKRGHKYINVTPKTLPYGMDKRVLTKTQKKSVKQIVKSMKETNYLYGATGCTPGTANLNVSLLNGCTQGDALGSRTGNEITMSGVDIRFCLNYNYTDATHIYGAFDDIIGIWIVLDTQANGAQFADGDFGGDGVTSNSMMRIDWDNRKRFKCIYHKVVQYRAPAQTTALPAAASNFAQKTWHVSKKLKAKTYYNGNAGTIADITKNALYLVVAGYGTYSANYFAPQLSWTRRVYFKE